MRERKFAVAIAAVISAIAIVVLPGVSAQADASWCGNGWTQVQSYQGPAGGTFKDILTRACIQKAAIGEYFSGDVTVYNGATNQGHYNGHYGSRYVRFGANGADAMTGQRLGYNNASKTLKGNFGSPTNDCYYGELMPGYQVTCASLWVLDNSPASANWILGYVYVGAWFWQAGMSQWQWGAGFGIPESSQLN